uniref:Uncharacterized protein n=1 Tax=Fagus sylvatica TaxID=28930 RepID=A0A2N9GNB6_FAGSY
MDFAYQGKHPPAKLVSMATASHAAQASEYWLTAVSSTDRLTPNLGESFNPKSDGDSDQVSIGNGQAIPITHIGHTYGQGALQTKSEQGLYPIHTALASICQIVN